MVDPPLSRLRLLGFPTVFRDGRDHSVPVVDKPWALLFYLALERGPQPREALVPLLWPDKSLRAGRANLSATLYTLGRWFGPALPLDKSPDALAFRSPLSGQTEDPVDAVEFFSDRAPASCDRLHDPAFCPDCRALLAGRLALFRGSFLEGAFLRAPEPFLRWTELVGTRVSARREELRRRLGDPGLSARVSPSLSGPFLERRQITLLAFLLSAPSDLEPEERLEAERAWRPAAESLLRTGGGWLLPSVEFSLLAAFGFPKAREEAAPGAFQAARAVIRAFRELAPEGLEIRAGLHAGEGTVDWSRNSPDATGDRTLEAGRVAREAPSGEIAASDAAVRLLSRVARAIPLGKSVPDRTGGKIDLFLLAEGVPPETGGERLLVGREEEQARLRELWTEVGRGISRTVWIVGEAGLGKSSLTGAMARLVASGAEIPAGKVRNYCCRPGSREIPWDPVARGLRRDLEFEGERLIPSERRYRAERLLLSLDLPVSETLPVLLHLLEGPGPWSGDLLRHPPEGLGPKIERLLLTIFARPEGDLPLFLVVEDLHWVDHATGELLRKWPLRKEGPPVLLLLTAREKSALTSRLLPEPDLILPLRRLDRGASRLLVESISGGSLPQRRLREILDLGEGVPLFLRELARSGSTDRLPATVRDLLASRIPDPGEDREIVEAAACLGGPFECSLLAAVVAARAGLPLSVDRVRERLSLLGEQGILEEDRPGSDPVFDFTHALLREAIVAALPPGRRRALHGIIAGTLRDKFPERVARAPEILAEHLERSGDRPGSVAAWITAAGRSASLGAFRDALEDLERALCLFRKDPKSGGDPVRELEILLAMGPLALAVHGYGSRRVEEVYGRAFALCGEALGRALPFPVLLGVAASAFTRSGPSGARPFMEQLERRAGETGGEEAKRAMARIGAARFWEGRLSGAEECLLEVLASPSPARDPERGESLLLPYAEDPAVGAFSYLSFSAQIAGRAEEALRLSKEGERRAREIDHPFSEGLAATFAAFLQVFRGDRERAPEAAFRTVSLSEKYGFRQWEAIGRLVLDWCRGDGEAALSARERVASLREMVPGVIPIFVLAEAETALSAGLPEMALEALRRGQEEARKTGTALFDTELSRLCGEALFRLDPDGNRREAARLFRKARDGARKAKMGWFAFRAALALVRLDPALTSCLGDSLSRLSGGDGLPEVARAREILGKTPYPV